MSEITKIVQEQFKTLPKIIQDTITSSLWQEKIRRVVKVNNLHIDQGAAIENLVLITMLGIETPENFVKNAQEYARVDYDQALVISAQVEREIFGDIRKKLIEATDSSGTVAEIDQATNELGKVSAAIEKEAQRSSKPALKSKIPTNYFDKNANIPAPIIEKPVETTKIPDVVEDVVIDEPKIADEVIVEDTAAEELVVEEPVIKITHKLPTMKLEEKEIPVSKLPSKPIFQPMPKEIGTKELPSATKIDPYRESVV